MFFRSSPCFCANSLPARIFPFFALIHLHFVANFPTNVSLNRVEAEKGNKPTMPTQRRLNRMKQVLLNRQRDLTVVCENIHDPHNVSAILRTCDAVGVPEVQLLYIDQPFPQLGKKSSASAKKWVKTVKHRGYPELRRYLKERGFTIYATHVNPQARSIYDIDWKQPSAIIMGNEHSGVTDEALAIADAAIYIPMFGMVESLNVSVATAVILYEAARQRLVAGKYPASTEDDPWFQETLNQWLGAE